MMTTRTSGAPPPDADNENDADASAVACLACDARSIQPELDEVSQACRERKEGTANDEASEVNGASQPPRLRESDLVSLCEACVAWSVGTEGFAAAVGGASSAAGSGRGPCQTNVLLNDVFDTTGEPTKSGGAAPPRPRARAGALAAGSQPPMRAPPAAVRARAPQRPTARPSKRGVLHNPIRVGWSSAAASHVVNKSRVFPRTRSQYSGVN